MSGEEPTNEPSVNRYRIPVNRSPLIEAEVETAMLFTLAAKLYGSAKERKWTFFQETTHKIVEAIQSPSAIFEGLERDGFHNGTLCYSAPIGWQTDQVLLAFAKVEADQIFILNWTTRVYDKNHPGHPLSWKKDFRNRLWPTH